MRGIAYAQTAGEGPVLSQAEGPGPLVNFLPLILVFAVFYFLLIRPQQQKTKEHRMMVANLRRNDEVITSGGIYGRVVELSEKVITLEIAPNVRVRVDRPRIDSVIKGGKGGGTDEQKGKEPIGLGGLWNWLKGGKGGGAEEQKGKERRD